MDLKEMDRMIDDFPVSEKSLCIINGSVGSGKTYAMIHAIKEIMKSKKKPKDKTLVMVEKVLEDVVERHNIEVNNDQLKKMTNTIVRFLQSNLFKNYLLITAKLYSIKQKVCNKQYWLNKLKYLKSKMGDVILTIIITKVIEKVIEILTGNRRLNKLPIIVFC